MKRLLLPLLAALALSTAVEANWFGKYNSRFEAEQACEEWVKNYKLHTVIWKYHPDGFFKENARNCVEEPVTKQFIGFESVFFKQNKKYNMDEFEDGYWKKLLDSRKPVKYFKY